MGYYKLVEGKKMDGQLLDIAEKAVRGVGDGRISQMDAETIFTAIRDGGKFSDVEKVTVDYICNNFKWTEKAKDWFANQVATWRDSEIIVVMTAEELAKQHFGKDDVLRNEVDRDSRRSALRAATAETYQDHDEIAIIVRLANGDRVEVSSNFIELEGEFVELRGGHAIPVRAIERVKI